MRIENEGQIRAIELPGAWRERPVQQQPLEAKQLRSFHSVENPNVQVRFVYRGHAESEETGRGFQSFLCGPPRALDTNEINSLAAVVGDLARCEEFLLVGAQVMDLAGRRVLWVEGRWLDCPYWSGNAFIDADGSGRIIQQVECFAEMKAYDLAAGTFQQILRSIVWK